MGLSRDSDPRYLKPGSGRAGVAWSMRALGRRGVPAELTVGGVRYVLAKEVKHDFFAATAFYDDPATGVRVVLKASREEAYAGLPLAWLGRWLRDREVRFYLRLQGVRGIPPVVGVLGEAAFVHGYVPGRVLEKGKPVPAGFFDELERLVRAVHERGVAVVDLNKPQNVLVGEDGKPWLIDFQISFDLATLNGRWPARWWLARMMREDWYHFLKHKKRLVPAELTEAERERAGRRSVLIRVHRMVFWPWFRFRRAWFKRLRETGRLAAEGSK